MFIFSPSAAPGMTTGVLTMAHMGTTHTLEGLVSQCPNLQLLLKSRGRRVCQCPCHRVRRGLILSFCCCFFPNMDLNTFSTFFPCHFLSFCLCFTALDARLEVGLEQQAELMLKMMATLQADSILQALTSSSSTGKWSNSLKVKWSTHSFQSSSVGLVLMVWYWFSVVLIVSQSSNGTDDSLLRALHSGGSPPNSGLIVQPSSIPILSACFNKLFSMLLVHHVQVRTATNWNYSLRCFDSDT